MTEQKKSYVCSMTPEQIVSLRELLDPGGWQFEPLQYAHWRAQRNKTTVVAYNSGKVTVQGRDTAEIVQFIIEPQILKEAKFGYEHLLQAEEHPEMFEPHAGIDESGKGDYFGPLVIAAAYVDGDTADKLLQAGTADSKTIKSGKKIQVLAQQIRNITRGRFNVVTIGPDAYNRLYQKFANVNRLLAWGHAKALENLLEIVPECPMAISDQFGNKATVIRALQEKGRKIELIQRTKAESDVAVAAASILARAEFLRRLEQLGETAGTVLPKGAGGIVDSVARELLAKIGTEGMQKFVKLHFKTTEKIKTEII